jgi:diacylglycerol kinase family enzyme
VLRQREGSAGVPLPQVLIIPVGTMNNIGAAIGVTRHRAVKLAKIVAAKIRENHPLDVVHRNPLKINDEYGFLYGAGLPVNFLQKYYEDHERRGPARALSVILTTLGSELTSLLTFKASKQILTRPIQARIAFPDNTEAPVAAFTTLTGIMCASIDQVGLGCRGMPEAASQPGRFMIRSTQLTFWGLAASLGPLWAGMPLPATFDAVIPRAKIDYMEPTIATVDGDLKPPSSCDVIACGPTVSFITG